MSARKNPTSRPSNEEWRPVNGYEGIYEISSLGRLRTLKTGHIKSPSLMRNGYYGYLLWKNNHSKFATLHRLLAIAFIPNPENKPCIDHINTIKTDNRLDNLRWCSSKENSNNPLSKIHSSNSHKGQIKTPESIEKWKQSREKWKETESYSAFISRLAESYSKPVIQINSEGEEIRVFQSVRAAARHIGKRPSNIFGVLSGRRKTAGGYKWKYQEQSTE